MTGMIDHMRSVLPLSTSQDVFFTERKHEEKGFLGTKEVTRLHLAVKGKDGKTVLLDEKGIKLSKSKGFFGTAFKIKEQSGQSMVFVVNKRSLQNFVARLEGKKVIQLGRKSAEVLGERVQTATRCALSAVVTHHSRRHALIQAHIELKQTIDAAHYDRVISPIAEEKEKALAAIEAQENICFDLEEKDSSRRTSRFRSTPLSELDAEELQQYRRASGKLEGLKIKAEQLQDQIDRIYKQGKPDYTPLKDLEAQLKTFGVTFDGHAYVHHGASDSDERALEMNWRMPQKDIPSSRSASPETVFEDVSPSKANWWVKTIQKSLAELKLNPEANAEKIAHYEALLEKHGHSTTDQDTKVLRPIKAPEDRGGRVDVSTLLGTEEVRD